MYGLISDNDNGLRDWEEAEADEDTEDAKFTTTALPNEAFDRLWELLVYEEPVGERILRALTRSVKEDAKDSLRRSSRCNNTVLLHGPPGSGKTTLCQALAQRLSIRLLDDYPRTKLLEIGSDALLSRYFGESGKAVGRLFKTILDMAMDPSLLVIVLFDEVESIAGCREQALKSGELADAHRVSIQLQVEYAC